MNTSIALLRGINVSGQNMIKMADLKALFQGLGFIDPETYLQSGNIIFKISWSISEEKIINRISSSIMDKFGFKVPVFIRSLDEMKCIYSENPFLKEKDTDIERLHVTFLPSAPEPDTVMNLKSKNFGRERFEIRGREIYLNCPEGYGRAKLNNNFLEKALGTAATTRNWKTVTALSEI